MARAARILARAALAGEQHGRCGARRHAGDQPADGPDRRRIPQERLAGDALGPGRRTAPAQRVLEERRQLVEIEGFGNVVKRAEPHRLDGVLDARMRRQHDHRQMRARATELPQHVEPAPVREPIVEHDGVRAAGLPQTLASVAGLLRLEPPLMQALRDRPADEPLVVGDEHSSPHDSGHHSATVDSRLPAFRVGERGFLASRVGNVSHLTIAGRPVARPPRWARPLRARWRSTLGWGDQWRQRGLGGGSTRAGRSDGRTRSHAGGRGPAKTGTAGT